MVDVTASDRNRLSWSPESGSYSSGSGSDSDEDNSSPSILPSLDAKPASPLPIPSEIQIAHHTYTTSPPKSSPLGLVSARAPAPSAHPYRPGMPRARPRGLSPLAPISAIPAPSSLSSLSANSLSSPHAHAHLPKAQPLARAMFARRASGDTPHAGFTGVSGSAPKKTQKMIVPTKSFRTTFELGLTSSELARK